MTSVSAPISLNAKGLSTLKIVAYQINAPLDGAIGGLAPHGLLHFRPSTPKSGGGMKGREVRGLGGWAVGGQGPPL